jgi:hypothetical protein
MKAAAAKAYPWRISAACHRENEENEAKMKAYSAWRQLNGIEK